MHSVAQACGLVLLIGAAYCDCPDYYFVDQDCDGFGNPDDMIEVCPDDTPPPGYVRDEQSDCDDTITAINPAELEVCDGVDNDCNATTDEALDGDGDDYSICEGDCDDSDPSCYPGAAEKCDGADNDCDGSIDEEFSKATLYRDSDKDGFGDSEASRLDCAPKAGYVEARGDCNDADPSVYPGAEDPGEDGIDQDCGGSQGADEHVGFSSESAATIQAALDSASLGTTVWVGPGTYYEHDLSFGGKAVTLAATHTAEQTVIDAQEMGRVFLFDSNESNDSVLDGFTLTRGYTTGLGGGVYAYYADPTLRNCVFSDNQGDYLGGGAAFDYAARAIVEGCAFLGNYSDKGGGLYAQASEVEVMDSVFEMNTAAEDGGGGYFPGSEIRLVRSAFSFNLAQYGGAICLVGTGAEVSHCSFTENNGYGGGAIRVYNSTLNLSNSVLRGNDAQVGGGISATNSVFKGWNSVFEENSAYEGAGLALGGADTQLENCLIARNVSSFYGGGISTGHHGPLFRNTTIVENSAGNSGGGIYFSSSTAVLENTLVAFNTGGNMADYGTYSNPTFSYSCIYPSTWPSHFQVDDTNCQLLEGEYTLEDLFMDDYHLALGAPVIDAGDPAMTDPDESRADIGSYGGNYSDDFDLDADGWPDYFWPGALEDSPHCFDPVDYDRDDRNDGGH